MLEATFSSLEIFCIYFDLLRMNHSYQAMPFLSLIAV